MAALLAMNTETAVGISAGLIVPNTYNSLSPTPSVFIWEDSFSPKTTKAYIEQIRASQRFASFFSNGMPLGYFSSPHSLNMDIGSPIDWSAAVASNDVNDRGFLQAHPGQYVFESFEEPSRLDGQDTSITFKSNLGPRSLGDQTSIDNFLYRDNPSAHNLHIQDYEVAPTESNLIVTGWTPSDGSLDTMDFDAIDLQIRNVRESSRRPLGDKSLAWANKASVLNSSTLNFDSHMGSMYIMPLGRNAADASHHTYPTWSDNMEVPTISDPYVQVSVHSQSQATPHYPSVLYAPMPVVHRPLFKNAVMMRSASGRPVGGVPPIFARSVTSNIIKKGRTKARAKIDARNTGEVTADSSCQADKMLAQQQDASGLVVPDLPRDRTGAAQGRPKEIPKTLSDYAVSMGFPIVPASRSNPANRGAVTIDVGSAPVATTVKLDAVTGNLKESRSELDDDIGLKHCHNTASKDQIKDTCGYFWPIGKRVKRGLDGKRGAEGSANKKCRV